MAVDKDSATVQQLSGHLDNLICVDASDETSLKELGLEYFSSAVVAIGQEFEANILITSLLKDLGLANVYSKALTHRQRDILRKVGADHIILPEYEAGVRLADLLASRGQVLNRLELSKGVSVSEVLCPPALWNKSLIQLDLRRQLGLTVVAIKGRRNLSHLSGDELLLEGDQLLVLGEDHKVLELKSWTPPLP